MAVQAGFEGIMDALFAEGVGEKWQAAAGEIAQLKRDEWPQGRSYAHAVLPAVPPKMPDVKFNVSSASINTPQGALVMGRMNGKSMAQAMVNLMPNGTP